MNIRVSEDSVVIEGYVNAVERLSRPLKDRIGKFVERIKAGAWQRALDRAKDVRILLNHDWNKDLGGINDGNLELKEDNIGLHARAVIKDKDVIEQAKKGNIIGWSFGFLDRDVENELENNMTVRNVKDLDLYEVSLINRQKVPAYEGTSVTVRTADDSASIFVSEVMESEINLRVDEAPNNDNPTPQPEIDYTQYKEILKEMKGEL